MNAFEQLTRSVTARGAKAKKANNAPIRLEITDDDFPEKRSTIVSKYTSTFEKMKPGQRVIELPVTMRHDSGSELDLMLIPQLSADHMRDGIATEQDWHTVVMRLNWGRVLNSENFENGGEVIAQAQDVMVLVKDGLLLNHEQYETVTSALTLCNQMQKNCTRRELRDSLRNMLGANEYLNKKKQIQDRMDGR